MKKASYFSVLALLHRGMLVGQLVFLATMFFLVYGKYLLPPLVAREKLLQVIALSAAIIAVGVSSRLFKQKLASIFMDGDVKQKLLRYRSAVILLWALTEIPVLVCGICLLLSGNYAFLALAIVVIIYFAMLMPVKSRIAGQLGIQPEEMDAL